MKSLPLCLFHGGSTRDAIEAEFGVPTSELMNIVVSKTILEFTFKTFEIKTVPNNFVPAGCKRLFTTSLYVSTNF